MKQPLSPSWARQGSPGGDPRIPPPPNLFPSGRTERARPPGACRPRALPNTKGSRRRPRGGAAGTSKEVVVLENRLRWIATAVLAAGVLLAAPATLAQKADPPDPDAAERIDINSAGVDELMELPGVGPAYAERIVAYREENGPFKTVEEIMNVRGIGEKTFLRIRDQIQVGKAGSRGR
ncbi:MAG: helix-hairpin-helix domain-containing protein [Acidobacteria bacterium]|nr:helix-hairpin-helix domain-containing protein [Acidobacteriota bacterium]